MTNQIDIKHCGVCGQESAVLKVKGKRKSERKLVCNQCLRKGVA